MEEGSPFGEQGLSYELSAGKGSVFKDLLKNKKLLVLLGVGILLVVVLIIIIIVVAAGGKSGGSEEEKKDEGVTPTKDILGDIQCIYEVESTTKETQIIGEEFVKKFDISIEINNKLFPFTKKYKFNNTGDQTVTIHIYDSGISLDNLFKNVALLTKIRFYTTKNVRIISMESLFENCVSLEDFTFIGFDTSQLVSLKRFFLIANH